MRGACLMGIVYRTRSKGGNTYTEYQYWESGKVKTIYCGIKGKPETEKKVEAARQKHRDSLLKRMESRHRG